MTQPLFDLPPAPVVPVVGEARGFPVHRVFCVGRNYAAHAAEMGNEVDREAPFYFTKSPASVALSGQTLPYPPGTDDYHHEMELAVYLGADAFRIDAADAMQVVLGYGCALDMTRRDLQARAKDKRRPWDLGKDVEGSAILAPVTRAAQFGAPNEQRIWLEVNGTTRQDATLADLIHSVPAVIADLSHYYHLRAGDVILTGTPAGVAAVQPGDVLRGGVDGAEGIALTIGPAE